MVATWTYGVDRILYLAGTGFPLVGQNNAESPDLDGQTFTVGNFDAQLYAYYYCNVAASNNVLDCSLQLDGYPVVEPALGLHMSTQGPEFYLWTDVPGASGSDTVPGVVFRLVPTC